MADKLINSEAELTQLGLPERSINSQVREEQRKTQVKHLLHASLGLLSAIHENAPFYPTPIRLLANEAHKTAHELVMKYLGAFVERQKGNNVVQTEEFKAECDAILLRLFGQVDELESLIRTRLADVQVNLEVV